MKKKNSFLSFKSINKLTAFLVATVAMLMVSIFALIVYSSVSLNTDGVSISLATDEQKHLEQIHAAANQYVIIPKPGNLEKYEKAVQLYTSKFDLLLEGGEFTNNGFTNDIIPAQGEPKKQLLAIRAKYDDYKRLIDVALNDSLLQKNKLLVEFQDSTGSIVHKAISTTSLNDKVAEAVQGASQIKDDIHQAYSGLNEVYVQSLMSKQVVVQGGILLVVVLCLSVFAFTYFAVIRKQILKPIQEISEVSSILATGDLSINVKNYFTTELGQLSNGLNQLVNQIKESAGFALEIGKRNFSMDFTTASEKDELGTALLKMRDDLKKVEEEERKRHWATEGFARFSDIIRKNSHNLEILSEEVLTSLVKYIKANQGALYIIDDTAQDEASSMKLNACYAWNRKKHISRQLSKGEGLAGQAWQEADTIYLTEVPADYVRITSGLGEANPRSILIVPLKINEEVLGVVEIASFQRFAEFEIDFVEKLAESIAAALSSVKVNERTKQLLEKSNQQAEEMRAQEEEMRQNMEELEATQEEMKRKETELRMLVEQHNLMQTAGTN